MLVPETRQRYNADFMKMHLILAGLLAFDYLQAQAALYSVGNVGNNNATSLNLAIPDGNPVGACSTLRVGGLGNSLSALTVTLNVSAGYNGDLYAYLSYNGTLVPLLNRVGTGSGDAIQNLFGYSTSGFNNVTLGDGGTSIHGVANPVSGTSYAPDGGSLASFGGANPNGTWTLFFADLSGGATSTLQGWSLDITAVPEPVNVALAIFGGLLAVGSGIRRWSQSAPAIQEKKLHG